MPVPEDVDRRKAERRGLRTNAIVTLGPAQSFEVRTVDISANGMAIVASANPRPGTVFDIRFAIPRGSLGPAPFEAKASVVHSVFSSAESGFKIGLRFTQLPPASAAAAQEYLG